MGTNVGVLDFELAYLARLTLEGLKPLSRWEGSFEESHLASLRGLGLDTRVVQRRVQTGKPIRELIFSRSTRALDTYAARFDRTAITRDAKAARLEGRLFGYPSCCVESYVARGYAANGLRRSRQRILFHWACPGCEITPLLLPAYREIHAACRREWRNRLAGSAAPSRASGWRCPPAKATRLAAALGLLGLLPANAGSDPDPHQLPLGDWEDPDADLLTTEWEILLGTDPAQADQDGNGSADGVDLARVCAAAIDVLPEVSSRAGAYITHHSANGLETCQVCGEQINMGFLQILHPLENHSIDLPYIAKHFLDHGSFTYSGSVHEGRINPVLLNLLLTTDGLGHFLRERLDVDADNDGLRDWEEPDFRCDPALRDTDGDQLIDGIQTARTLEEQVRQLPRFYREEDAPKDRPYAIVLEMDGVEICPRCGERVVMEDWTAKNPLTGRSIRFSSMGLHFLRHGAFAWTGGYQGPGRVDPRQLRAVLEGDGDGHPVPGRPDSDGDFLSDEEEVHLSQNPGIADEDTNGTPDGIDVARRLADQVAALPKIYSPAPPPEDRIHAVDFSLRGLEVCEVCGEWVNMGHLTVCHPKAGLYVKLSYIALHYLEHGGLSFAGNVHGSGRTDPHLLDRALDPDTPSHTAPIPADSDGDGLADDEEKHFGCDPKNPDTANDGVPDGFALARGLWEMIEALPRAEHDDGYREDHPTFGMLNCPVCGTAVNMGCVDIIHPRRQQRLNLSYLDLHYLQHGSFVRLDSSRLDPLAIEAALRPSLVLLAHKDQLTLRWTLRPGRTYQLWFGDSPLGPWELSSEWLGDGTEAVVTHDLPPGTTARFYRLTVR